MKTVVVGADEKGRAIEHVLYKNHADVALWDPDPQKIPGQSPLATTVPHSDLVFLCVSSWLVRETISQLEEHLPDKVPVVTLATGADRVINKTMDEVLTRFLPQDQPWAILGGPLLPEELQRDMGGAAVVACESKKIFNLVEDALSPEIQVEYSSDVRGVAIAGAVKSVYSLVWGISEGLNWGLNKRSWLLTQITKETAEIINYLGGQIETSLGPAGLGSLLAGSLSADSLEYKVGREIAGKNQPGLRCEGLESLPVLTKLLGEKTEQLPVFKSLTGVIDGRNIDSSFGRLWTD